MRSGSEQFQGHGVRASKRTDRGCMEHIWEMDEWTFPHEQMTNDIIRPIVQGLEVETLTGPAGPHGPCTTGVVILTSVTRRFCVRRAYVHSRSRDKEANNDFETDHTEPVKKGRRHIIADLFLVQRRLPAAIVCT